MAKSKLVIGFLTLAIGVFAGSTGVASAIGPDVDASNPPATKQDCKKGGWQQHADENGVAFKNQGQCVKWVNAHGYSGQDNNVDVAVNTKVKGDNNIIRNAIDFIFGSIPSGNVAANVNTDVEGNGNFVSNIIKFVFN
jgi:hypothetical protein